MAIKRCPASIDVVEAAKIRIRNVSEMVSRFICLSAVGKTAFACRSW